jgi:hypothetical protein
MGTVVTKPLAPRPWRKPLARLSPRHELAAQLLAQGRQVNEVSGQTGFTPNYVSHFRSDPLFAECLARYAREREDAYTMAVRRWAEQALGVDALSARLLKQRSREGRPRGRPFGAPRGSQQGPAAVLTGGPAAPAEPAPAAQLANAPGKAPETRLPDKGQDAAPGKSVAALEAELARLRAQLIVEKARMPGEGRPR